MSLSPLNQIRERFAEMVSREDDHINLDEAALLIAAEEYPRLDADLYLERLDHFADLARERATNARDAIDAISAVNATLFETLGFRGNREDYYDPRNSFLNEVIDRRRGIPITLTVVYIEVARRIGFPVKGVGLPFHFIAKHEAESSEILIDPFNEGRLLGFAGCAELVAEMSGGKLELQPEHLESVSKKQLLSRMLSNLLGIYARTDHPRALAATERLLLINPDSPPHIRDRGLLLASTGNRARAIVELERYLEIAPDTSDAEAVRQQLKEIRQSHARMN